MDTPSLSRLIHSLSPRSTLLFHYASFHASESLLISLADRLTTYYFPITTNNKPISTQAHLLSVIKPGGPGVVGTHGVLGWSTVRCYWPAVGMPRLPVPGQFPRPHVDRRVPPPPPGSEGDIGCPSHSRLDTSGRTALFRLYRGRHQEDVVSGGLLLPQGFNRGLVTGNLRRAKVLTNLVMYKTRLWL